MTAVPEFYVNQKRKVLQKRIIPDCIDGVGREVADGGQLVVVHELGLPLGERLVGSGGVVHLHQQLVRQQPRSHGPCSR